MSQFFFSEIVLSPRWLTPWHRTWANCESIVAFPFVPVSGVSYIFTFWDLSLVASSSHILNRHKALSFKLYWGQGQPSLPSQFQDSQAYKEGPCLKKKKNMNQTKVKPNNIKALRETWLTDCLPVPGGWTGALPKLTRCPSMEISLQLSLYVFIKGEGLFTC